VQVPALSHEPAVAVAQIKTLLYSSEKPADLLVGSSLGGYYATFFAELLGTKAVLVNPAVAPHRHLARQFLGLQTNLYSGQQYLVTETHLQQLADLWLPALQRPENLLVLLQTDDEVLDYRIAEQYYSGAKIHLSLGGGHEFASFEDWLPAIMAFARGEPHQHS
jgi:uncharacterized protein